MISYDFQAPHRSMPTSNVGLEFCSIYQEITKKLQIVSSNPYILETFLGHILKIFNLELLLLSDQTMLFCGTDLELHLVN